MLARYAGGRQCKKLRSGFLNYKAWAVLQHLTYLILPLEKI